MNTQRITKPLAVLTAGLLLISVCSCNSKHSPVKHEEKHEPVVNAADPGWDLNCVYDHLQNPTESFYYSYKHDSSSDSLLEEGDLTPQTIDGNFKNNYASRAFHATRSDSNAWQNAIANLDAISGMAVTFTIVRGTSATVREGTERVNGYETVKYSIDTARGTAIESTLYRNVLGPGGFEKGFVWAKSDSCPVKFVVDAEMHLNDGSVQKDHFEEAMIKK